ncbi:DUF2914 domain-containing protein [candidate division KSB1 bacterium]|nr:DUF2914 domain-containing protein [candidate division KSB1 bacterium]RQW02004.1 MAG: DUF2914 domain-containing protein [candidate division KSB1 bacterium]
MLNYIKNFKAFWLLELILFCAGFIIVYNEFGLSDADRAGAEKASSSVAADQNITWNGAQTALETAVVCLDIDVERKMPLLAKGRFSKYIDVLFCFTEIAGPIPDVLVHEWIFADGVPFRQRINLNGSERRAWTKMSMSPEKSGKWRVDIRTGKGDYLGSAEFVLK